MKINLLKSTLGILVIGIAGYAHATTLTNTAPGPIVNPGDFATFSDSFTAGGSFADDWFFQLSGTGAGGVVVNEAVTVSTTALVNISGLSLSLWTESAGSPVALQASGGTDFNLPSLAPGLYELIITGTVTGTEGGAYAGVVASPSAVPLPAAAWLLLSGLVGVGAMARRRRTV
jgi:hypothetical protein